MLRTLLLIAFIFFCTVKGLSQTDSIKSYYENGQLKSVHFLVDSVTRYEKNFHENGTINAEGYAHKIKGKFREINFKGYYENGDVRFVKNDTILFVYNKDGTVMMKAQMRDGTTHGLLNYYINGKLSSSTEMTDGVVHGKTRAYSIQTGKLISERTYENKRLVGPIVYYDTSGTISKKEFYKDYDIVKVIYYHRDGTVKKIVTDKKEL